MAEKKDLRLTISILNQSAFYGGAAISNFINILDPQIIILGGILIQKYPRYFDIVSNVANARKVKGAKENLLAISKLGENAGVIGAGEKLLPIISLMNWLTKYFPGIPEMEKNMFRNNTGKEFPVSSSNCSGNGRRRKGKSGNTDGYRGRTDRGFRENPTGYKRAAAFGDESTAAIYLHARKQPEEPFSDRRLFLDARKGVSYRMKLSGVKRMFAIYQHKDWWIRPAFPKAAKRCLKGHSFDCGRGSWLSCHTGCVGRNTAPILQGGPGALNYSSPNCINKRSVDDFGGLWHQGQNPYQCCELAVKKRLRCLEKRRCSDGREPIRKCLNTLAGAAGMLFIARFHIKGL